MKCPNCNLEIDENMMSCPMCQAELPEQRREDKEEKTELPEAALLMTANDEIQANIVESLLKVYGIPMRRKYKGNDTYGKIVLGLTIHGIDLYVPLSALEEAKAILENELPDQEEIEQPVNEESEESTEELLKKYDKRRRTRAWIILLFFTPGFVILAAAAIYVIINLLART